MAIVRDHPGNRLSASMLASYAPNWGLEITKLYYESFTPTNKESVYGKRILQYITLYKAHHIGDRYSDFEMNTPDGKSVKLSDLLGKVTLIEFGASCQ
jgi:hypothetical protein